MRIGLLTGGGDCPGLNAVIRAVVVKGVEQYGYSFVGYRDGWRGPLEGEGAPLGVPDVRSILLRGGTVLGSGRVDPLAQPDGAARIKETLRRDGVDALIVIGGNETLAVAEALHDQSVPVVGVPKAIDNYLTGTERTFGFDTAVGIATDAVDRLHTTAESHHRALVIEVMGRRTGWIALHSGVAGGANVILIPEHRFDVDQVCAWVEQRFRINFAPIVVVASGALPQDGQLPEPDPCPPPPPPPSVPGTRTVAGAGRPPRAAVHGAGIGERLAAELAHRTGQEARTTVLGSIQRGGKPSPYDRWLATRFGLHAVEAVHDADYGVMVALRGGEIERVPLAAANAGLKTVDPALYAEFDVFFG